MYVIKILYIDVYIILKNINLNKICICIIYICCFNKMFYCIIYLIRVEFVFKVNILKKIWWNDDFDLLGDLIW